jgi:hemoglobin/transferrin/lactoferrin receptor protein
LAQYQNIGEGRFEGIEFEGNYDAGDWFVQLAGQHIRGRDLTAGIPLATIQPDKVATTLGVRLVERKLLLAVTWLAVDAKPASEIPDRNKDGLADFLPTSAYNVINLYLGYQPTPDVLASIGVDNVFNQFYVPYMSAEGQSLPGQPPPIFFPGPGVTFKGSLKIRFGTT